MLGVPYNKSSQDEQDQDPNELLRKDVIQGLVQLGILSRLTFLLQQDQMPAAEFALDILSRCCRHSDSIAKELAAVV